MNKILYYARNTTMLIIFGALMYSLKFVNTPIAFIIYPIFLALGILTYLQNRNDVKIIESNKRYNLFFTFINLFTLLVLTRNFFDPYIMYNQFFKAEKNGVFLSNNFLLLIILYGSLLTYNILITKENKKH